MIYAIIVFRQKHTSEIFCTIQGVFNYAADIQVTPPLLKKIAKTSILFFFSQLSSFLSLSLLREIF